MVGKEHSNKFQNLIKFREIFHIQKDTKLKYFFTTLKAIYQFIIDLPLLKRKLILIIIDFFLIANSYLLSLYIFSSESNASNYLFNYSIKFFIFSLISIYFYDISGQYKGLTRYVSTISVYQLAIRNLLITAFLFLLDRFFNLDINIFKEYFSFWFLLTCFSAIMRFTLRDILLRFINLDKLSKKKSNNRIAIYGAGVGGAQLEASLRITGDYEIVTFIDDNPDLWNRSLNSIPITPPKNLINIIPYLDKIFIAIPSLGRIKRKSLIELLEKFKIPIFEIPSLQELTNGTAKINEIRPIDVIDLLGRDPVPPIKKLLEPGISGYRVLVTGAGGSIGSELCRQIINLNPKYLIMLESNEPSLYSINQEIQKLKKDSLEIKVILGNTCDEFLMNKVFAEFNIDIVFHAAAYKHVPLVEQNPLFGLLNNVFSTLAICKAAKNSNIKKVVLISSDKAVRPTNIMGASKRLSELIVQAHDCENKKISDKRNMTIFTSVRFGNVLGSSGSVVPLFRQQINSGGPITLNDENMVRYFMTIPEAVQLVIQASVLSKGGDIFLLDMGKPVKIYDLAVKMINLSGFTLKDKKNMDGDIEIICTGIREGEKLFEELLIDGNSQPTSHPLIYKAIENQLEPSYLWPKLDNLKESLSTYDKNRSLRILSELVKEWNINSGKNKN